MTQEVCERCGKTTFTTVGKQIGGAWFCFNCAWALSRPEAPTSKDESLDSTEQYYAHMESDRHAAETAYFTARPLLNEGPPVETFRAGFERAYRLLWNDLQSSRRETDRACQEYRELNAKYVQDMRATSGETGCSDGYKHAFYQIADLLDMTAMPISPKEAFETVMLPKIRELAAASAPKPEVPAEQTVKRVLACLEPSERYGVRVIAGHTEEFWAALAEAFPVKTNEPHSDGEPS
jgi:hypothetical protein